MEKKVPKLALVAGPKPEDDTEDYGDSISELAEILGVAPEQTAPFRAALKAFVMACK